MKKELIIPLVSLLHEKGLLKGEDPLSVDSFIQKLYINNEERLGILQVIISVFSEEYKTMFMKSLSLENDLARKISDLGFIDKNERFDFVRGTCSKDEQQNVYEKIFRALHFILVSRECPYTFSPHLLTEDLLKQDCQPSLNKQKKRPKKKFNQEQAKKNFEMAQITLENAMKFMEQHKDFLQTVSQPIMEDSQNKEEFIERSSVVESFRLLMEKSVPPSSMDTLEHRLPPDLVRELFAGLQLVADSTQYSTPEVIETRNKLNLEKMYAEAKEIEQSLASCQCFLKDS